MNWLCVNNIELEDKSFLPKIEIKELTADEVKLPEGWDTFDPVVCMNCYNKEQLSTKYFELNISNENMLIDREIKRIMKEKYNVEDYGHLSGGEVVFICFVFGYIYFKSSRHLMSLKCVLSLQLLLVDSFFLTFSQI